MLLRLQCRQLRRVNTKFIQQILHRLQMLAGH